MIYTSSIDNQTASEWGLNLTEAYLFSWLFSCPSWADMQFIDGVPYYFAARQKAIQDLPLLPNKDDTVYRLYRSLCDLGVIQYHKVGKSDFIRITEKGKKWNSGVVDNSEKNPRVENLGKKSEITRKKIRDNSEKNPTYYNINNYSIKDYKEQIGSDLSQSKKNESESNRSEAAPKNEPLQGGGAKPKSEGLDRIEKGRHEMKEAATVFDKGLADYNEARAKQDKIFWDKKEIGQLKTLLSRIKAAMKEAGKDYENFDQVLEGLRYTMQLFTKHDVWFTDRFLPSNFVSHWSDILNLRAGAKAKPKQTTSDKKQNINDLADALTEAKRKLYQQ